MSSRRIGLPKTVRMRHEAHFVDQLVRPSGETVGRVIPIEDTDGTRLSPDQWSEFLSRLGDSIG